jgi:hypothetical protein
MDEAQAMHARRPFLEVRGELLNNNNILHFSSISIVQQVCTIRGTSPTTTRVKHCTFQSTAPSLVCQWASAFRAKLCLSLMLRGTGHLCTGGGRGTGGGLQRGDAGNAARPADAGHLPGVPEMVADRRLLRSCHWSYAFDCSPLQPAVVGKQAQHRE